MPDLLVKLYGVDFDRQLVSAKRKPGIDIQKPIGPEKHFVINWIKENFSDGWASEADIAFSRIPCACYIAVQKNGLVGFGCYDATALGFFGPIGVLEAHRGGGIGAALLNACMLEMKLKGYGYAIVGHSGASPFFRKTAGAVDIEGSTPGIYRFH